MVYSRFPDGFFPERRFPESRFPDKTISYD